MKNIKIPLRNYLPRVGGFFPDSNHCQIIFDAVREAEENVQAPVPMIFSCALAAISVAAQGVFDVIKPNGQRTPCSLMLLSIAKSGERKSTVENIFLQKIRSFQGEHEEKHRSLLRTWEARFDFWDAQRKSILKEIRACVDDEIALSALEERLVTHEMAKPLRPKKLKLLYEDSTSEALFKGLDQNFHAAGLISSEGAGILNGRALSDFSKQNSIWSGDTVTIDRVSSDSYELRDARLTVSVQIQEEAFRHYMARRGDLARDSGLFARFLVCRPVSTQGKRFIDETPLTWGKNEKFSTRLLEILRKNLPFIEDKGLEKELLLFSQEAKREWIAIFNEIEFEIKPGGRFHGMEDHASKLADNITRVSALLHCFEGFDGDISVQTLRLAVNICLWYSDEFFRIFVPPPQEVLDAVELMEWLMENKRQGYRCIKKNKILQYGPSKLRKKGRLDLALEELERKGEISIFSDRGAWFVEIMPRPIYP